LLQRNCQLIDFVNKIAFRMRAYFSHSQLQKSPPCNLSVNDYSTHSHLLLIPEALAQYGYMTFCWELVLNDLALADGTGHVHVWSSHVCRVHNQDLDQADISPAPLPFPVGISATIDRAFERGHAINRTLKLSVLTASSPVRISYWWPEISRFTVYKAHKTHTHK